VRRSFGGVAATLLLAAGCQVEAIVELGDRRTCGPHAGEPIRADQAIDALRRGGFNVKSEQHECFGDVAATIGNTRTPEVLEREGFVSCFVRRQPPKHAPKTVVRRGVDGGDAELVLENLACVIFTDRPDPKEKIDRLEQAFEELQRAIPR
jgi:hypothetical protein